METKVRFAPSPTGYLHIGGLRTALYNYLYAKKVGGKILLRIEDTDQTRKVDHAVENLISTFKRLNIQFDERKKDDEGNRFFFQSKRLKIYKQHIKVLLKTGNAYPCFCSLERLENVREKQTKNKNPIKYDRHCLKLDSKQVNKKMISESHIIRMKVPSNKEVVFYDMVRDKVTFNSDVIDDQVLIKSDGYPTYHFANVVDDHLMGITHVIRGEEWVSSTPKHILLYQYFGWKLPRFIHLPLLLNPDKSKLSKRQGDISVEDYLNKGFIPEALINFVVLLGWHPKNEREIFSLEELEEEFSIKHIQKSGAVFDKGKLEWMNSQYLMNMDLNMIAQLVKPFYIDNGLDVSDKKKYLQVVDNARRRVNTLIEMPDESLMFYGNLDINKSNLNLLKNENAQSLLKTIHKILSKESNCDGVEFKNIVVTAGNGLGMNGKEVFSPLRTALYGNPKGPDIPNIFSILGRDETLCRLLRTIK